MRDVVKPKPGVTEWGWMERDHPGIIDWVPGSLAESYAKVSIKPGNWRLVSAVPVSEYHRVMAETAQAIKEGKS